MTSSNFTVLLRSQCANCKIFLTTADKNFSKVKQTSSITNESNIAYHQNEISNTKAISYIFGLSEDSFCEQVKSTFDEQNDFVQADNLAEELGKTEDSPNSTVLIFCEKCGPIFAELYEISTLFRNLADPMAILWKPLERHGFNAHLGGNFERDIKVEKESDSSDLLDEDFNMTHFQEIGDDVGHLENKTANTVFPLYDNESTKSKNHEHSRNALESPLYNSEPTNVVKTEDFRLKKLSVLIKRLPGKTEETSYYPAIKIDPLEENQDLSDGNYYPSERDSSDPSDEEFSTKSIRASKRMKNMSGKHARPPKNPKNRKSGGLLNFKTLFIKVLPTEESSKKATDRFKCKECAITCSSRNHFKLHYLDEHFESTSVHPEAIKGPPFKCPKCIAEFKEVASLRIHAAVSHYLKLNWRQNKIERPKTVLKCHHCDITFSSNSGFSTHQSVVHNKKYYRCSICREMFPLKSELEAHKASHPKIRKERKSKKKKNEQQEAIIDTASVNNAVESVEYSEDIYFCRDCSYKFSSRQSLMIHQRKCHDSRQKYDCKSCDESFVFLISFLKHSSDVHKEVIRPTEYKYLYTCTAVDCGSTFYWKYGLRAHQKTANHSTFAIMCAFCEESFTDPMVLEDHRRKVHNNQNVCANKDSQAMKMYYEVFYKCNSCQVIIKDKTEMTEHKLTHPDVEKIYKCLVCQKLCSSYHQWSNHNLVHRDACKDFQCETCGRKFNGLRQYRYHCRLHAERATGIRPVCDVCGKSYITTAILNKHKKVMHYRKEEKICLLCGHVSQTSYNLTLHMRVHEKNGILRKRKSVT